MSFFSISHQFFPTPYIIITEWFILMVNQNWMQSGLSTGNQAPALWGKEKPFTHTWSAHYPGNLLEVPWFSPLFMCKSKLLTGVLMLKFTVLKIVLIQTPFWFSLFFPLCALANKHHKILFWIFSSNLMWALVTQNSPGLGCWHLADFSESIRETWRIRRVLKTLSWLSFHNWHSEKKNITANICCLSSTVPPIITMWEGSPVPEANNPGWYNIAEIPGFNGPRDSCFHSRFPMVPLHRKKRARSACQRCLQKQ